MTKTLLTIQKRFNEEYNLFTGISPDTFKDLSNRFIAIADEELESYETKSSFKTLWNNTLDKLKLF